MLCPGTPCAPESSQVASNTSPGPNQRASSYGTRRSDDARDRLATRSGVRARCLTWAWRTCAARSWITRVPRRRAPNAAKAGRTIPLKFSLGANRGLDIFAQAPW